MSRDARTAGMSLERRRAQARAMLAAGSPEGAGCLVKLCGMMGPRDVEAANASGCDLVGFIVDVPASRRSLEADVAAQLARDVSPRAATVAVVVDEPPEAVAALATGAFEVVQLHGHEDAAYLRRLRALTDAPVIQAFVVRSEQDVALARASEADMVLLDAGRGSGRQLDRGLLAHVGRPYLLAGGLGPANVAEAVRALHPLGVDMSSGIETDGHKDPQKMEAAVAAVRRASYGK